MRKSFLVLGAFLALVFGIGIFLFLQSTRPILVEVPVAVNDIPAGTVLRANLFRASSFSNADPQVVSQWVTVNNWSHADGRVTNSEIRAGFPIAKSQVDETIAAQVETRLSLLVTNTNEYYAVIPTKPDEVGNFIQPGDRVDIILSIGDAATKNDLAVMQQNDQANRTVRTGATTIGTQEEVTQTSPMPITKLVMQNLTILKVDRNTPAGNASNQQAQGQPEPQPTPITANDVKRIYVRVDRDQLEVLSFVLNNGKHNFAVRAANGSQDSLPSDGVTWSDFVRWFYAQRGNTPDGAQPFDAISPSIQNPAGR